MLSQVSVKHKAPLLVRLYNIFLLLCYKIGLVNYALDQQHYLDRLAKEKELGVEPNDISAKALKRFIANVNSKSLNPATQIFIKNELERVFSNRIKIAQCIKKNCSVTDLDLSGPVFITGLPRTGTTALQNLFSLIGSCRVLKLWELHYPTIYSEGDNAIREAKEQTKKYAFLQNFSKPEQKYIHPVGAEIPDECFRLLFNSFTSIAISSALGLDDYEKWVLDCDLSSTYKEYKTQLQLLSQKSLEKQLVLKAPEHLWNLEELIQVFPSAKIIMTHRDPLRSVASYASMISMFRRTAEHRPDFKQLGSYVTNVFAQGMKKAIAFRKEKDLENQIVDVHCNDIQRAPIETFKTICNQLNIHLGEKDNEKIKNRVKAKGLDYPGSHLYNNQKYGVNRESVGKAFRFYNHNKYMKN